MSTGKFIIPHNYHLVEQNFPIPSDGIIGIDFIKKFNCLLDCTHTSDTLILRPDNLNFPINIPITHTCDNNATILPARAEVVRQIKLESTEQTVLIPNQEIEEGIFIGNTISNKDNIFVRILNTTN